MPIDASLISDRKTHACAPTRSAVEERCQSMFPSGAGARGADNFLLKRPPRRERANAAAARATDAGAPSGVRGGGNDLPIVKSDTMLSL